MATNTANLPAAQEADSAASIRNIVKILALDPAIAERAVSFFAEAQSKGLIPEGKTKLGEAVSIYFASLVDVSEKLLKDDPRIPKNGIMFKDLSKFRLAPTKNRIRDVVGNFDVAYFMPLFDNMLFKLGISDDVRKTLRYVEFLGIATRESDREWRAKRGLQDEMTEKLRRDRLSKG